MELLIFFALLLVAAWLLLAAWMPEFTPRADRPYPIENVTPTTDNPWEGTWWTTDAHYASEQGTEAEREEYLP